MVLSTVLGHLRVEKNLRPIQETSHDSLDGQPLGVIIGPNYVWFFILFTYPLFEDSDLLKSDAEPLGETLATFPRNVWKTHPTT
jgi:hypothetical protein